MATEKRYQIFVSSTYADLKDERQKVLKTLLEMNCIPAGMELFPAADEEQLEFIRKIIDDCDYYLLIIGGRYGSSATSEGVSFTEAEYNHAVSKNIKVIALLHENPGGIIADKTDKQPKLAKQLTAFRDKAKTGRMVRFWNNAEELPGLVALSLLHAMKAYPATGWVRADSNNPTQLLGELNELRKENDKLKAEVGALREERQVHIENMVDLKDTITLHGDLKASHMNMGLTKKWELSISWERLFALLAPHFVAEPRDIDTKLFLRKNLQKLVEYSGTLMSFSLNEQDYSTIMIQFQAYKFITHRKLQNQTGSQIIYWMLTNVGKQQMYNLRVIRKPLGVKLTEPEL